VQVWLAKTVEREMAESEEHKKALTESIRSGTPSVFVNLHKKAMIALIAGNSPVSGNDCPETLGFDSYRLFLLHMEVQYLVFASTVLVTITSIFPPTTTNFKVLFVCNNACYTKTLTYVGQVMDDISDIMAKRHRDTDVERLLEEIWQHVEESSLNVRDREVLKEVIRKNVCPEAVVCKLM
jgi:hypothetical protein